MVPVAVAEMSVQVIVVVGRVVEMVVLWEVAWR